MPSGLDATTGAPPAAAIRATATLTLALPKSGLRAAGAEANVAKVSLADIGILPDVYRHMGLDVGHPFEKGSIVRLLNLEEH